MGLIWRKVWSDLWHQKARTLLAALSIAAGVFTVGATAGYRLGGDFGSNWLDRWVERLTWRFFSSPYAIVLAKLFRHKGRLLLPQLVLISAGTMFLMAVSLAKSTELTVTNDPNLRAYDIHINFEDRQFADRLMRLAQTVPGVEQSEVWLIQSASILKEGQQLGDVEASISLTGIPTDTIMYKPFGIPTDIVMYKPIITSGRWVEPGDERVLVISKDTADDNDLKVGDVVTLNLNDLRRNVEWEVIGVYQTVFDNNFNTNPAYAPLSAVYNVIRRRNLGTRLLVRTDRHDEAYLATISKQLQTMFEGRNMGLQLQGTGTTYEDRQFANNQYANSQYAININILQILAVILAIVGGIGLMGALSISVVERTREIGIMRAIGARSQLIMSMFVLEGLLQGLISWSIAMPLSFLINYPMVWLLVRSMLDINLLDYSYSYGAVFVWLAIILVIAALASIVPAHSATRISVQESLAYA